MDRMRVGRHHLGAYVDWLRDRGVTHFSSYLVLEILHFRAQSLLAYNRRSNFRVTHAWLETLALTKFRTDEDSDFAQGFRTESPTRAWPER